MAAIQFEKASINPNSDEALLNLSKVYFDDGRLLKAIEIARKGLLSKPKNIPILKNLKSLILLNRFEEASVACKKILSINKDDADAINLMGTIYEKKGLYDQAKKNFLKALELDKDLVEAKINIATIYQLEGNEEKANEIYNDLIKEFPENAEVLYRKSAFAIQMENFEEGWRYYEYRWKVFPMNKVTWPIQDKPIWKGERGKRKCFMERTGYWRSNYIV